MITICDGMFTPSMCEWDDPHVREVAPIVDGSVIRDPEALRRYIADNDVSYSFMTSTFLKAIGNGTSIPGSSTVRGIS